MLRPGDPVYYDVLHSYMGYRTCYYRSFAIGSASLALKDAYKRCRDYLDASIELIRPGRSTSEVGASRRERTSSDPHWVRRRMTSRA